VQIFGSERPATPRRVLLDFGDVTTPLSDGKDVRDGLSVGVRVGPNLFVATDEGAGLIRMTVGQDRFRQDGAFPLAELLDLPSGDAEVDVEGMEYREPYLWITGSHGVKRRKADPDADDPAKEIARLAKTVDEPNRYLLARVPLCRDAATGAFTPVRSCADPADPERMLTAARVRGDGRRSQLMKSLADDPHLSPFMGLPDKDNGFNVEGLTVAGDRVFLGLRGPVLRGWAVLLEVEPAETDEPGLLKLKKIGPDGRRYRKHFLDLGGLGIRELSTDGPDLLLLAGPTLPLSGPVVLCRWKGGAAPEGESLVRGERLEKVMHVPHGDGTDHAEGITLFRAPGRDTAVLVVYDSPSDARKAPGGCVYADLFPLAGSAAG
jgi:hypothetical protein